MKVPILEGVPYPAQGGEEVGLTPVSMLWWRRECTNLVENATSEHDEVLISWFCLYVGALVCLAALVMTRQAYKLSAGYQTRLAATGFHQLSMDAVPAEKARIALAVLQDSWPATVSEMLQDTEAAHGMLFRSLMVVGCLVAMQTDFAALVPRAMPATMTSTVMASAITVLHLLRRLVFAAAIGFCFAPSTGRDHSVAEARKETLAQPGVPLASRGAPSPRLDFVPWLRDATVLELPPHKRAEFARTSIIGTV